jgi:hypothetical protein
VDAGSRRAERTGIGISHPLGVARDGGQPASSAASFPERANVELVTAASSHEFRAFILRYRQPRRCAALQSDRAPRRHRRPSRSPPATTCNGEQPPRRQPGTLPYRVFNEGTNMNSDSERERAAAETVRQRHERDRQAAESARHAAERARESAEDGRREVANEVHGTIATLTTLVDRMESVEALRREARKREP